MSFRTQGVEGEVTRRTEVTVHERERTLVLVSGGVAEGGMCPLCGQPVGSGDPAHALHTVHSLTQAPAAGLNEAPPLVGEGTGPQLLGPTKSLKSTNATESTVLPRRLR